MRATWEGSEEVKLPSNLDDLDREEKVCLYFIFFFNFIFVMCLHFVFISIFVFGFV